MGFPSASISSSSTSSASSYITQATPNPSYITQATPNLSKPTKDEENSSQDRTVVQLFANCVITAGLAFLNPWAAGIYGVIQVAHVANNFFSERKAAAEALIKQREALILQREAEVRAQQEQEARIKQEEARTKQELEARLKLEKEAKAKQEEEAKNKAEIAKALAVKMTAEAEATAVKMAAEKHLLDSLRQKVEKKAPEAKVTPEQVKRNSETPSQAATPDVTAVNISPKKHSTPELPIITLISRSITVPLESNKPVSTCKRATSITLIAISAITFISASFFLIKSRFFNE